MPTAYSTVYMIYKYYPLAL